MADPAPGVLLIAAGVLLVIAGVRALVHRSHTDWTPVDTDVDTDVDE